ncbi:lysophospholipid acyltransferase family protein [Thiomicrorhabdus sediminis]|uniref:Lipid A biosynthesis acyltransferase n=1 Tax=Thiomicrorhabdus sediminis TaxID=2580412 RepID=A0A4P9K713_9GAMM|nr:lysophospholipid acyltransferase family protein [Thiomicrorhabdus sediminis]QCU90708.1 lipid A biosynthesis acyltransferase [Thiomicrorhabdus sediminis]
MHNKAKVSEFSYGFLHPKYWGIWLMVGFLRLLHCLPWTAKLWLGKKIGRLFMNLSKSRRETAKNNIRHAFPELDESSIHDLTQKHFESLGISLFESMLVWWGDHRRNKDNPFEKSLVSYENIEVLRQAEASKKGVIILVPHFTTTDIIGLFLSFKTSLKPVYRPHDNLLMDYLIAKGRTLDNMTPLSKFNTRAMIKTLKSGENLGFLPDQRFRAKGRIDVPFFGENAPSNPATSKLAQLTGCIVLPTFLTRLDNGHYVVRFEEPVENFPSGDDYEDTLKLHHIYEQAIRANPAQYLWVHNRWDR